MRRFVVIAGMIVTLGAGAAHGQPVDGRPRFDVASIKPAMSPADFGRAMTSGANGGRVSVPFFGVRTQPGGRLQALANLQGLILTAYGIQSYQIEGGPKWLTTDYFEVAAKSDRETATDAELFDMLKSLLAERFGLRLHVETRQTTVHTPTSPECMAAIEERKKAGASAQPLSPPREPEGRVVPICGMTSERMMARTAAATFMMGGQPLSSLVARISRELNAPVVDRTGLAGEFDVTLEFESSRRFRGAPPPGPDPNSTDPLPVPLPQALQQQLGLKLDKAIGPLPITIVDAAEHPSPN